MNSNTPISLHNNECIELINKFIDSLYQNQNHHPSYDDLYQENLKFRFYLGMMKSIIDQLTKKD